MTTRRALCTALAPAYLARSPPLPTSHRQVIRALQQCRSGHDGHRLSHCPSGGGPPRVQHAGGTRHCPPCPPPTTQQGLQHHLAHQLPGPHCLLTCTVPETLRPFVRSPQRLAYHAMCHASSEARKRLATDERFLGTERPGFLGGLPTWGRQLPSHPHLHSSVPGGGLAADRAAWLPSRANVFGPVQALSPISRALWQEEMRPAGRLESSDPQGWTIPWNVHSQANPHGHTACKSLAPSGCTVAISNSRIVCLKDRTGTFPSRKVGSARPRPTTLDAMEFLRRFLQPGLPDGGMTVRHCGSLHASCALPPDTLRLLSVPAHPIAFQPTPSAPPAPLAARCPTCGAPMRVVMRLWTANRACVDTG